MPQKQDPKTSVDHWFRVIELDLTIDEFHTIPQHPDYKYEYFNNRTYLSPRPKAFHALLNLEPLKAPSEVYAQEQIRIRPLRPDDDTEWQNLKTAFQASFLRTEPFASLSDDDRAESAHCLLDYVRQGGEGPLVTQACFVAESERRELGDLAGAILITLYPDRPLTEWHSHRWPEPPPADAIAQKLGRPHLTWIFVPWLYAGHGIGSTLLAHATNALLDLGYRELATTFYTGNHRSALWHWRNGFQLAEYPGSTRKTWREIRAERQNLEGDAPSSP